MTREALWNAVAVGCGGFVGSVCRYALSGWVVKRLPAGTLAANVLGCLLIGVVMSLAVKTGWPGPRGRAFLVAGLLGGLTTFSTFAYQTWELAAQEESPRLGAANLLLNIALGLAAVWLGIAIGSRLADMRGVG